MARSTDREILLTCEVVYKTTSPFGVLIRTLIMPLFVLILRFSGQKNLTSPANPYEDATESLNKCTRNKLFGAIDGERIDSTSLVLNTCPRWTKDIDCIQSICRAIYTSVRTLEASSNGTHGFRKAGSEFVFGSSLKISTSQ